MRRFVEGILLVDKDEDETSYSVVRKVKAALGRNKRLKVGHSGTLDPFATGLLIILLGQGTKLSPYLMKEEKLYRGTLSLGTETDTLDSSGKVIRTNKVPRIDQREIERKAGDLVGDLEQVPPVFSAAKYQGKRAYQLARRGEKPELGKRRVRVHELKILSVNLPEVSLEVQCSGGTYVRSLAADLGKRLGTGGHLSQLRRIQSGAFHVRDALKSRELEGVGSGELVRTHVLSLREALPDMPEVDIDDGLSGRIRKGYQPGWKDLGESVDGAEVPGSCIKLVGNSELIAIAGVKGVKGSYQPRLERVFHTNAYE